MKANALDSDFADLDALGGDFLYNLTNSAKNDSK